MRVPDISPTPTAGTSVGTTTGRFRVLRAMVLTAARRATVALLVLIPSLHFAPRIIGDLRDAKAAREIERNRRAKQIVRNQDQHQ